MPTSTKSTGSQTSWMSQPGIQQILGTAANLFNSGAAWKPNTTSQVTPFSTQTVAGLTGMNNFAKGAQPSFANNFTRVNEAIAGLGGNGLTNLQDQQVNALQGIAGGNGLNTMQQQAADWLQPVANGSQIQNNPYLQDIINKSANDIRYQTGLNASAAGRYGSGGHEGVLQNSLGNMETNLRYGDYANQQARQDAAIQNYGNLGTTGANQRNDAIGSLYNAGQQGLENIQGGTSALNDAYNARLSPYQTMMGVGNAYENKNTQVLQDQARQFQERKNSMTDPVNWLANLASAYNGGQQVSSGTTPYNPFQQGIGGGIAAYGATGNPYLGLLGGLGGLF